MIRFQYKVPPISLIMGFEKPYPEPLQFTLEEKTEFLSDASLVGVWMWVDENLVGETYGLPNVAGIVYCYSNTVLETGKGWGTLIKAHWLGLVKGSGYWRVEGHARPGASQALNVKFGAVLDEECPDWYGTGETYRHYTLVLD